MSLSAHGTRVAVGAPFNDGVDENSGRVRIYDYSASSWVQVGDIAGAEYGNCIGTSVSLSADGFRVAIGSDARGGRSGSNNKGYVEVYEYSSSSSSWLQIGATIEGEARNDRAGSGAGKVSLSADGTRLAIGAPQNGDSAYGIGHVRVYEYSSSSWVQVGADLDGAAARGYCGTAVSLSVDGSRVAFSCPGGDAADRTTGYDQGTRKPKKGTRLAPPPPAPIPLSSSPPLPLPPPSCQGVGAGAFFLFPRSRSRVPVLGCFVAAGRGRHRRGPGAPGDRPISIPERGRESPGRWCH